MESRALSHGNLEQLKCPYKEVIGMQCVAMATG